MAAETSSNTLRSAAPSGFRRPAVSWMMPIEVENLLAVARFKVVCRKFGITEVSLQGRAIRISPVPLRESQQMRLARLADGATYKAAVETVSLKVPVGPDRRTPLRDVALLENLHALLTAVLEQPVAAAS